MVQVWNLDGDCFDIPPSLLPEPRASEQKPGLPRLRYGEEPLTFGEIGHVDWIRHTLKKLPDGWRILDVGAGILRYKPFCQHLDYVSQDFCKYDGKGNGSGIQIGKWETRGIDVVSDACNIPEPDASFDAILCVSVLEHLPEPNASLKEFARLLRSGGKLILTAPFAGVTHFAPYHYYGGFTKYFYETHLAENFVINDIHANGSLFQFINTFFHYILSFAEDYTDEYPSEREELAIDVVTEMLRRFSMNEKDVAADILNFGYQIEATRQ